MKIAKNVSAKVESKVWFSQLLISKISIFQKLPLSICFEYSIWHNYYDQFSTDSLLIRHWIWREYRPECWFLGLCLLGEPGYGEKDKGRWGCTRQVSRWRNSLTWDSGYYPGLWRGRSYQQKCTQKTVRAEEWHLGLCWVGMGRVAEVGRGRQDWLTWYSSSWLTFYWDRWLLLEVWPGL